jgi:hypothetical protein
MPRSSPSPRHQILIKIVARFSPRLSRYTYMLERGPPVITTDLLHAGARAVRVRRRGDMGSHLLAHGPEPKDGPLDPFRIASEGALWGGLTEAKILDGTVIFSDGAGQFAIGEHARCWVHMERQIHADSVAWQALWQHWASTSLRLKRRLLSGCRLISLRIFSRTCSLRLMPRERAHLRIHPGFSTWQCLHGERRSNIRTARSAWPCDRTCMHWCDFRA